jgi:hypothetical protein
MAALTVPASLKTLETYIQRAKEMDGLAASNPQYNAVAYYCRMAAAQAGIEAMAGIPAADQPEANAFLGGLLAKLEADRVAHGITKENEAADLDIVKRYA